MLNSRVGYFVLPTAERIDKSSE